MLKASFSLCFPAATTSADVINFRVLYGSKIKLCAWILMQGRSGQGQESSKLANLAAQTLIRRYTEECEALVPYVKDLLGAQNVALK